MNTQSSRAIVLSLALASLLGLGGCVAEPASGGAGGAAAGEVDEASPVGEDAEENVASVGQAIYSGWTPYTSEEYPPATCDAGSVVDTAQCSGWCCDNIRLSCRPSYRTPGPTTWTSYFSEEGTNYRFCPSGAWLSGIACNGAYCDNIALQCTTLYNTTAANCYWTGWMSEENGGTLYFGTGYYARGVQCDGWDCDNKRYYVCQMY